MAPIHHHFELKRLARTKSNHSVLDHLFNASITEFSYFEIAISAVKNEQLSK